ncbi:hypothetical protein [Sporosarcina sp. A2]|uniref:hypothetical protein n=1 Tax=Sporosarcina sp. A2 TaxID=3393449 RepID=UPI003D7A8C82
MKRIEKRSYRIMLPIRPAILPKPAYKSALIQFGELLILAEKSMYKEIGNAANAKNGNEYRVTTKTVGPNPQESCENILEYKAMKTPKSTGEIKIAKK